MHAVPDRSAAMTDVSSLHRRRLIAAWRKPIVTRPAFYFDLASPFTYLAAERADRMFAGLVWIPAACDGLHCFAACGDGVDRAAVRRRAELLGMPLVWPVASAPRCVAAMRVASLAAQRGLGAPFALAASRLVYCGSFDLDSPEILAEAAALAGIEPGEARRAAADAGRDGAIEEAGRLLLAAGADRLPVVRVERTLFCGEQRLDEAAAVARTLARSPDR
jgi:2-hydroxychromene-2-carboxylate isomerase